MSDHLAFQTTTDMAVYFCDPGSPWQRGSNENTNGLLRQYFPKGTDLSRHTPDELQLVAAELNARPRKTLDWDTPAERLHALLNTNQDTGVATIAGTQAGQGKLYLCAVKDCYSNRIVGYSIDSRMKSSLAVAAIGNAIALRTPTATILHSDRGSQFRSKKVVRLLRNNALRGSMGRVGACGDNAAMESFFSLLQKNILDTHRWQTREELRLAIVTWIETKYNRRRRQGALGKVTPVEFEMIYPVADAA